MSENSHIGSRDREGCFGFEVGWDEFQIIGSESSTSRIGCRCVAVAGFEGGRPKSSSENKKDGTRSEIVVSLIDVIFRRGDRFSLLTLRFFVGLSNTASQLKTETSTESDETVPRWDALREGSGRVFCRSFGTRGLSGSGGSEEIRSMTSGMVGYAEETKRTTRRNATSRSQVISSADLRGNYKNWEARCNKKYLKNGSDKENREREESKKERKGINS